MNFIKQHRKNLKKLTKKQLIQQVLNWIDISSHMESQFNDSYEDLMWLYVKQRTELEDTQEALSRNRNQLESYKMFESLFVGEQVTTSILESSIKSAESAIRYYENMSVFTFIKNRIVKRY